MDEGRLSAAVERAEQALTRIERCLDQSRRSGGRDDQLRAQVREAVAELDQIIRKVDA